MHEATQCFILNLIHMAMKAQHISIRYQVILYFKEDTEKGHIFSLKMTILVLVFDNGQCEEKSVNLKKYFCRNILRLYVMNHKWLYMNAYPYKSRIWSEKMTFSKWHSITVQNSTFLAHKGTSNLNGLRYLCSVFGPR